MLQSLDQKKEIERSRHDVDMGKVCSHTLEYISIKRLIFSERARDGGFLDEPCKVHIMNRKLSLSKTQNNVLEIKSMSNAQV